MKFLKWLALILLVFIIVYFLGPKPAHPRYATDLPVLPETGLALEQYISAGEASHKLKPDNEARIIWINDSLKTQTDYSVVYLHGFSSSQGEGAPVHADFARKFGCNLYLARLADHGIDTTEPMLNFTVDRLWNSAREAYAIGRKLGKKVILMGTSTGGTLALKLAAEYPDIAGIILLSPNIALRDPLAWVANNHWGLHVAKMVKGQYNTGDDTSAASERYWYYKYRIESIPQLEELLETSMKASLFEKITQPLLMLYYYRDEDNHDPLVKVSAMKRMYRRLGTPDSLKRAIAVPDAGAHVLASPIKSKDVATVERECGRFAVEILHLTPTQ